MAEAQTPVAPSAPPAPESNEESTKKPAEPQKGPDLPLSKKEKSAPEVKEMLPAPPKPKYKVKVDEEEIEVDEDELKKGYSRGGAATKRFQEAAQIKSTYEEAFQALLRDPLGVINQVYTHKFGEEKGRAAARHFAEQFLGAIQEEEALPEDKREAVRAKKDAEYWRQEYEKERQRKEKEAYEEQLETEGQKFQSELEKKMSEAGVPDDEETLAILIPLLQTSLEKKYPLTVDEAIDIVKERREAARTRHLSTMSDDDILKDEARRGRLRERILQMTKDELGRSQGSNPGEASRKTGSNDERRAERGKRSLTDFFNQ